MEDTTTHPAATAEEFSQVNGRANRLVGLRPMVARLLRVTRLVVECGAFFSAGARFRHALRGIKKEGLFGDALTLPTLIRQLIHHHEPTVVQLP